MNDFYTYKVGGPAAGGHDWISLLMMRTPRGAWVLHVTYPPTGKVQIEMDDHPELYDIFDFKSQTFRPGEVVDLVLGLELTAHDDLPQPHARTATG